MTSVRATFPSGPIYEMLHATSAGHLLALMSPRSGLTSEASSK